MHWQAEKVQYPDGREVSYTYGKVGERRSITYPDGKTVFYGYDEQLRLSELKEGDSVITYGYDPVGRLCEKQFPNGTKTTYRYDRKDQLTDWCIKTRRVFLTATPICMTFWEIRPESPRKEEAGA